jgi:arylsulfatase A-like enzyme
MKVTRRKLLAAGAAGAGLAAAGALGLTYLRRRPARNVILVVADALRADRVGMKRKIFGQTASLTPNIDALAGAGVTFANAVAPSSWTPISMFSMMFNCSPLGIRFGDFAPIGREHRSIAQRLKAKGYVTICGMANEVMDIPEAKAGFDEYQVLALSGYSKQRMGWARVPVCAERYAPKLNAAALALADKHAAELRDKPLFLQLHYMDTHDPYNRTGFELSSPWSDRINAHNLESAMLRGDREMLTDDEGNKIPVENALGYIEEYYDAAVYSWDSSVQILLEELGRRGLMDDSMLIFTADHGEEFFDNKEGQRPTLGHNGPLTQEQIRVPLVVSSKGRRSYPAAGQRVSDQVSSREAINRLIEDYAGVTAPDGSIAEAVAAGRFPAATDITSAINWDGQRHYPLPPVPVNETACVLYGNGKATKVIRDHLARADSAFELAGDGAIASGVEVSAALAAMADKVLNRAESRLPPVITPEMRERLKALGYLN